MSDIKSAREIAMEKINAMGEPTEQERMEWKYLPEGEKMAARYLKGDIQLQPEIAKIEKKAAPYITRGIYNILIKNVNLPVNENIQKTNKLALDGIKIIKTEKTKTDAILKQIAQIFSHYSGVGEQQRQQAYQNLKEDFSLKVQQALQQQMGSKAANMRIDVEKQPQFLEEWRKIKTQLDGQYVQVLGDLKAQLDQIN
ncbi:MAG TPA: hypothetical protein VLH15_00595 [Dehalococcoidales bacterium]|nr:hypothetical protein [Dehalococcoidales bacterium]